MLMLCEGGSLRGYSMCGEEEEGRQTPPPHGGRVLHNLFEKSLALFCRKLKTEREKRILVEWFGTSSKHPFDN